MATFSVNQASQLYVVTSYFKDTAALENEGQIVLKESGNSIYFSYKGAGGLVRSDLIDKDKIMSVTSTSADKMAVKIPSYEITLSDDVNGGELIVSQDYILRVVIKNYVGMSDEDMYFKYGMVHATSSMDKSAFYKKLAMSLVKNLSREPEKILKVEIGTGDGGTMEILPSFTDSDLDTTTAESIIITACEPEYRRGIKNSAPADYEVQFVPIIENGEDAIWGTYEKYVDDKNVINNGKKIADLEYFLMGERGDLYRGMAWPHNIETKYMVDPTQKYNVVNIHYYSTGSNESVQKSEKDIVLVSTQSLDNVVTDIEGLKA